MRFDHCYQVNPKAGIFHSLKDRGFNLDDHIVEHPGGMLCRFIRFKNRMPNDQKHDQKHDQRPYQYLEFVEVTDTAQLLATYPKGTHEAEILEPGFSLISHENLASVYESQREPLNLFEPKFEHKNYDWKNDDKSPLPGWNYLTFDKPLLPGVHVWCTEYEPRPSRSLAENDLIHPNSVETIFGFIWTIPFEAAQAVATFTSADIKSNGDEMSFEDGSKILFEANSSLLKKNTTPFAAVVLCCSDWRTFCAHAKPDKFIEWRGQRAGLIQLDKNGWDILVIEKKS